MTPITTSHIEKIYQFICHSKKTNILIIVDFSYRVKSIPPEIKLITRYLQKLKITPSYMVFDNQNYHVDKKSYEMVIVYGTQEIFEFVSSNFSSAILIAIEQNFNYVSALNTHIHKANKPLLIANSKYQYVLARSTASQKYEICDIGLLVYIWCTLILSKQKIASQIRELIENLPKVYEKQINQKNFPTHAMYEGDKMCQIQTMFYDLMSKVPLTQLEQKLWPICQNWQSFYTFFAIYAYTLASSDSLNVIAKKYHLSNQQIDSTIKFWNNLFKVKNFHKKQKNEYVLFVEHDGLNLINQILLSTKGAK